MFCGTLLDADHACLHQVQAEVAGPGADLERAVVTSVELGSDELAELPEHLRLTDLAEIDAPFGVVAPGRDVVVASIDIADLVRGPVADSADLVRGPGAAGLHRRGHITLSAVPVNVYVQRDQPPGVPPLELTGERTLPDVPAENYWFRRHLAVYERIGARVAGRRVLDMA